jgi:malate dehydrogenase (oxaloacetate-decarboxylating)(NADP+)
MDEDIRKAALDGHRLPRPGTLGIEPTKPAADQNAKRFSRSVVPE